MFSNRLILALEKVAKIDIKELRKQAEALDKAREAMGKAAGGKKKLDEAGKVYDERVSAARLEALRITRDAEAIAEFSRQDIQKQREALINSQNSLEVDRGDLLASRTSHAASMASLKLRERNDDEREGDLDRRETALKRREVNVQGLEAEKKEWDAYRKAAPA